ncbi:MAG: hypothetical protein GX621_09240, partial [Pirellulaceae bacterium]|nr:hypothetical protein [Pirellulaceae bacterium]
MRTLNVRLLAILLGITAVVAIGVFGINRFQRHRHAGTFLEKARELNKGDTLEQRRDAESNFVSYLRLVPDDTVARAEFGLYCADMAQAVAGYHELAVDQLERVLREDISHDEARRRLVEIYLPFRRFSDAKKHLDVLRQ